MINWQEIETVLLDMDGTLLDKHFDDYFWEHFVPEIYAAKNGISELEARKKLLETYRAKEGTLDWTDLDYWSEQLDLDIPALKIKIDHLIQVHPYVIDFLEHLKNCGKPVFLVTNAHSKTLSIKMAKTSLSGHFTGIICAEEIGMPKENPAFWAGLKKKSTFSRIQPCWLKILKKYCFQPGPTASGISSMWPDPAAGPRSKARSISPPSAILTS